MSTGLVAIGYESVETLSGTGRLVLTYEDWPQGLRTGKHPSPDDEHPVTVWRHDKGRVRYGDPADLTVGCGTSRIQARFLDIPTERFDATESEAVRLMVEAHYRSCPTVGRPGIRSYWPAEFPWERDAGFHRCRGEGCPGCEEKAEPVDDGRVAPTLGRRWYRLTRSTPALLELEDGIKAMAAAKANHPAWCGYEAWQCPRSRSKDVGTYVGWRLALDPERGRRKAYEDAKAYLKALVPGCGHSAP